MIGTYAGYNQMFQDCSRWQLRVKFRQRLLLNSVTGIKSRKLRVVGSSYENLWGAHVGQMELTYTPRWPHSSSLPFAHIRQTNTYTHTRHVWSRHPASHKPPPQNISRIWPFNCGLKIYVITECLNLGSKHSSKNRHITPLYKRVGARDAFLFIADWNQQMLTTMNLKHPQLETAVRLNEC